MKTFLTFFVLFFSSLVVADDISDFEIEGISIGDSLLDHFNERELKEDFVKGLYSNENDKFIIYEIEDIRFKNYDGLQIALKRNDKTMKIYSLIGNIIFEKNIEDCYFKEKNIVEDLSSLFTDLKKQDPGILDIKDGSGTFKPILFDFDNGDRILIACYDWKIETGWVDNLKVSLYSKEHRDFMREKGKTN